MNCHVHHILFRLAAGILLSAALCGCSSYGLPWTADQAETREVVQGQAFRHLVLTRHLHDAGASNDQAIFVFLENDGLPWQTPTLVSNDPTPRHPVALALFRKTDQPSIYLGRPCQWVGTFESPCQPFFWTGGRFHPDVVNSLVAALEKVVADKRRPLILVGHSGGGTLAVLMAHRYESVAAVVTVAAVLDHRRWTSRLALTPLSGSLNPSEDMPQRGGAPVELHAFGALDEVVMADDAAGYLARFDGATLVLPRVDHACCWESWWVAEGLERAMQLVRNPLR